MEQKVTYLLGAGASANALPMAGDMDNRISVFIEHLKKECSLDSEQISQLKGIYKEISRHYTIDTYAKKLFLKGRQAKDELFKLYNFMGTYFIYEQLRKDPEEVVCSYLFDRSSNIPGRDTGFQTYKSIIESVDYRYDSFYAALLKSDEDGNVYLPPNINIISWNYDFQLEISFMNFLSQHGLDEIQNRLNIFPTPSERELKSSSSVIKINGTAGFYNKEKNYGELFDFRNHTLNRDSMDILKEILFQKRADYKHLIHFAWIGNEITEKARNHAREILTNTNVVIVIGYSFPYFNREVDKNIFSPLKNTGTITYIQTTADTFQSVKNRAIGACNVFMGAQPFTELDQFLIPNEL